MNTKNLAPFIILLAIVSVAIVISEQAHNECRDNMLLVDQFDGDQHLLRAHEQIAQGNITPCAMEVHQTIECLDHLKAASSERYRLAIIENIAELKQLEEKILSSRVSVDELDNVASHSIETLTGIHWELFASLIERGQIEKAGKALHKLNTDLETIEKFRHDNSSELATLKETISSLEILLEQNELPTNTDLKEVESQIESSVGIALATI